MGRKNYKINVKGGFENKRPEYCAEIKIDGLKIILTYEKGILVSAATRGDGKIGEDVTHNIKTIHSVPLTLEYPVDLVAVGEVWLPESDLKRINIEREEKGEAKFANARNAAAGSVRQLDSKVAASRGLQMFVYDIDHNDHTFRCIRDKNTKNIVTVFPKEHEFTTRPDDEGFSLGLHGFTKKTTRPHTK